MLSVEIISEFPPSNVMTGMTLMAKDAYLIVQEIFLSTHVLEDRLVP